MSLPACLKCQSEFVYQDRNNLICPECAFEWNPEEKLIDRYLDSELMLTGQF